ncbi:MAG TPA: hypothetical protein PKD54_07245 [Pirellulaceae bacterium]|nr:hypothetical protein [Pirellulaceae bacterium]
MLRCTYLFVTVWWICCAHACCLGDFFGVVESDRFGYTGTTTRYATLADALANANPLNTIPIGNRDISLSIVKNVGFDFDRNIIMGAWWYSTHASGNPGVGNTRGNTGIGYLQLFDDDASSRSSLRMGFTGYDGTFFRKYVVELTGHNAGPTELARFSPFSPNTQDGGIYLTYELNLLVDGLEGMLIGSNEVESLNQPTGVSGSLTGIFQNTSANAAKQGFYTFTLNFDMTSWAWENRDDLTYPLDGFAPSYFYGGVIPEPHCAVLLLMALSGLMAARRRAE